MHGERRQSKKLSIPPIPADARRSHSGVTPLGATPRTGAEEEAGRTRIARPLSPPSLTDPGLPQPLLTVSSPVDLGAGLDWDDDDLSTRLFDRPSELPPVPDRERSSADDGEVEGTPRISRLELEELHARLQQDASPGGARGLLQAASLRTGGGLTKLLVAALVFAGLTFLWVNPERDVSQLVRRGRIVVHEWQAAYDSILPSTPGQ